MKAREEHKGRTSHLVEQLVDEALIGDVWLTSHIRHLWGALHSGNPSTRWKLMWCRHLRGDLHSGKPNTRRKLIWCRREKLANGK
jgi:hypothetical protein